MVHVTKIADIVIGIWLCISPWAIGYAEFSQAAYGITIIVGLAVLLLSFADLFLPAGMGDWFTFSLGLGLIISPWTWGYSDNFPATANAFMSGLLISGAALGTQKYFYGTSRFNGDESHHL